MSKTNTWENDLLLHVFNNSDVSLVGDATGLRGSSTAGSLFLSLHTADPGEAGAQNTNETTYTGYARVGVARSGAGFTVSGNAVNLAANVDFGQCTASPGGNITHFGIGASSSGAGKLLYKGALNSALAMAINVIPRMTTTQSIVTED